MNTQDQKTLTTLGFSLDGVLANSSQYILDQLMLRGTKSWTSDWHTLSTSLRPCCDCDRCPNEDPVFQDGQRLIETCAYSWSEIEPFEDIDFVDLNDHMAQGEFVGYVFASRAHLDTPRYDL